MPERHFNYDALGDLPAQSTPRPERFDRPAIVDALAAQAEQDNLTLTGQLVFLAGWLEGLTQEVKELRREVTTLRRAVVDNAGYATRCAEGE